MENSEIEALETFFASAELPSQIQLTKWERVNDIPRFIAGHLATIKSHIGNKKFEPYFDRLVLLRKLLEEK